MVFKREKSGALKSLMSRSPAGAKFAAGRAAMQRRRADEAAQLAAEAEHALVQFSGTIETMFLAAASDGRVSRDEISHMADIVDDLTDGDLSRDDVVDMIQDFATLVEEDGYEGRLDALGAVLDPDTRRSAFILAAAVAMGDGVLDEGEEELFYDLADVYEIPDDEAEALLDDVAANLAR